MAEHEIIGEIKIDELDEKSIVQYAIKMKELRRNIATLIERIQDLLEEDHALLALFDVAFVASMRSAHSPDMECIIGSPGEVTEITLDLAKSIRESKPKAVKIVREESSEQNEEK